MKLKNRIRAKGKEIILPLQTDLNKPSIWPTVEAYKNMRSNLFFFLPDEQNKVIVISSPQYHEGKTGAAINIAFTIAEAGKRVILVDADIRRPGVSQTLGLDVGNDISDVLLGSAELSNCIIHKDCFDVLPCKKSLMTQPEILGSEKIKAIVNQLTEKYDYVLLDASCLSVVTDAAVLARTISAGMILVVKSGVSKKTLLRNAVKQLNQLGVSILGFVLTETKLDKRLKKDYAVYTDITKV